MASASDSPPWAAAPAKDQLFVLITGANSGVGLSIGQRIIDEFLASRSASSHLILIPTTRSVAKSRDTLDALHSHLDQVATRRSPDNPASIRARVHLLSVQLDLCDLRQIYAAADQLVHGHISDPSGRIAGSYSIPRLDVTILNAGIGGWSGFNWLGLFLQTMFEGIVQAVTYPGFKDALPAVVLDTQKLIGGDSPSSSGAKQPPALAEVFTANVFGHYLLVHELMPILSRSADQDLEPARVCWTSSVDAQREHLDIVNDFQAATYKAPYESSKRISDVLALTSTLPSVQPVAAPYFSDSSDASGAPSRKPRFYLTHPGIVCTPLFPLNWFLFFWYDVVMRLARFLGSPWHTVDSYTGAAASSWLALASAEELDDRRAHLAKWGSACDKSVRFSTGKMTEVEDWGWQGQPGDDGTREDGEDDKKMRGDWAFLRKRRGRKWNAVTLTEERREAFEEEGRAVWAELERLRLAWEEALDRDSTRQ